MDRPYVICHMLTSLDGKIDGDYMTAPENTPVRAEYGRLRGYFNCSATFYGTVTLLGGFADGKVSELPESDTVYPREDYAAESDVNNYIVAADPEGILDWPSKYIEKKGRAKAHVIEALTERASDAYLTYLRNLDISYIFAGKEHLDCTLALKKLKKLFGIERLMLAGGGLMNGSFLQEDLIDQLSLVISPLADGNTASASVFDRGDFLPARPPAAFSLRETMQLDGNGLWLRYTRKGTREM